jgi:type IV pilus assembly protein PilB
MSQKRIKALLTTENDLQFALAQYRNFQFEDEDRDVMEASSFAPAVRIINTLLKRAVRDMASDILLEPTKTDAEVSFVVEGKKQKKFSLSRDVLVAVIWQIKNMANLNAQTKNDRQEGYFSIKINDCRYDFRITIEPIEHDEKATIHLIDKSVGNVEV